MSINSYENYPLTWRPDKTKLHRPIYQSLITQLESDILSNKLQKNTRLPSQRELADFLDINFTTVGQAYKLGLEKGLLYTNIGSGTFVSPNAFTSITISSDQVPDHIIDFGLVSSFEQCNEMITPFIQAASQNHGISGLLSYREPLGTNYQLTIAKNWLETQSVYTSNEQIAIVSGVQNGLAVTLAALFSPGDRLAVDRYTYSNFIELAQLYHMEIVPIDFDDDGMLPELLEQECRKKKIHGIFLMPSCNNPIGFQLSEERRLQLKEVILKEQLIVIEDDIHSFMTTYNQKTLLPSFQQLLPEQTIYLAGMTKYICAGLRVAFLVFPEKYKEKIQQAIFNINVKTSSLEAEIITQILCSETAQKILETKANYTKQANEIFDTFFNLPRPTNPLPFYRPIAVRDDLSPRAIEQAFLNKGVRVYHSHRFTTHPQDDPFIRIALSSNPLEVLTKGLEIVKKEIIHFQR
ncbi:PLP-dependent aminotransferase family protein [Candidatus Enterococcus mangumiae]|uniref:HTH gntR-type domain-containing protein n=1 Tax=Candidatus Enterococcus mangumiae TaxID=2230878 RepID=A0ABZ2SSE9_9ENTE|nr:PLP-dependent aminotransferase family protein [Enterococcus sp. DIV1094]MBO0488736.1 PLP-dependent aminotransferase family protein [Enterococcus sp. DIV1094]